MPRRYLGREQAHLFNSAEGFALIDYLETPLGLDAARVHCFVSVIGHNRVSFTCL